MTRIIENEIYETLKEKKKDRKAITATTATTTTTTTTTTIKGVVLCNIKKHITQTQENGQEKRFLHVLTASIREMRQKTFKLSHFPWTSS